MALGALKRLTEQGVRVPQDISLVGFDDIAMASYSTPSLSTVRMPKYEMGRKGFEMLQHILQNQGKWEPSHTVLKTGYIARESVAAR